MASRWSVVGLVMIMLASVVANITAQEGYKEYRWRESRSEVVSVAGELEELYVMMGRFPAPAMATFVLYKDDFGERVPDPTIMETREFRRFAPIGTGDGFTVIPPISFWFAGDQLVAVELAEFSQPVLNSLVSRYGSGRPANGVTGTGYEFEAAAWADGDRIILWDVARGSNLRERVTYISKDWLDGLVDQVRDARQEQSNADEGRLD